MLSDALKTADYPREGGGSSTNAYENEDVTIYRGYRQLNGVSPETKVCNLRAGGMEIDCGPAIHEKVMVLLAEHAKSAWDDKESVFRKPKDKKAAKAIRLFVLRTILREFAKRPSKFFAWLERDREEQKRLGADELREQIQDLLGLGDQ